MKKIMFGMMQCLITPFIILGGSYLLYRFQWVNPDALTFATVLGGFSVFLNWGIGMLMIVKGYQEIKAFEGW